MMHIQHTYSRNTPNVYLKSCAYGRGAMRDSRAAVAHEQSVGEGPKIIRGFPRRTCGVEGKAGTLWALMK
jgi:hypothetical protein